MTMTADAPSASRPQLDDQALVFVGGCDRSGTTLVSRVIAERLSLVAAPEAYFHVVAYRRFGARATTRSALRHWRRRSWNLDSEEGAGGPDLADFLRTRMAEIVEERRGPGATLRVVESTPENIEVGSILLEQFPNAHLVHLVRDPRGVAASLRQVDFGPRSAQECARLWKQRIASGLALEMRYPNRVHRIRFEDLVSMPTDTLASLDAVVAPDLSGTFDPLRDVMFDPTSASVQRSAMGAPDLRKIWSWRSQLSLSDIAAVEYECRELMGLFGYEPTGHPDNRPASRRRVDAIASAVEELTVGTGRRAARVGVALAKQKLASR